MIKINRKGVLGWEIMAWSDNFIIHPFSAEIKRRYTYFWNQHNTKIHSGKLNNFNVAKCRLKYIKVSKGKTTTTTTTQKLDN